jgi:glyoxylase I family protein
MVKITELLHVSVLVSDLQRARDFYEGILALTPNPNRPDLGFPGIWYDIGRQQIHLLALPNPDAGVVRPEHGGRDRHLALGVEDFEELKQTLDRQGLPYTLSRSGRMALFCRDPDGNGVELIGAG